jgi:tetratricopeptide (TPR) repeat protein
MRNLILALMLVSAATAGRFPRPEQLSTDRRIAACREALDKEPGSPAALADLASAYLQKNRETADFSYVERAEKLVAQALARQPDHIDARVVSNEIELQRHHFAKVASNVERLLQSAPDNPRLWALLGDASMELGNYDRAAAAYERMVDLRPGLSSYNRVAWYRFVTGDAEGAISAMRQAVRVAGAISENTAWCLVDLGNLYFKTDRLSDAGASYAAALKAFPQYHPAFAGLGQLAAARHQTHEAIAFYRRAQAIVPLPEYAGALRELYLRQENSVEARKQEALLDVMDQLARANSENTDRSLAMVLADQGRHLDRALELARNELEFRRDVYTYDALAWVLHRAGHHEEAREAMKKALAWNTPEPSFRRHAAQILK